MLSILNAKCQNHHNCQTSIYVHEHGDIVMGCIVDGRKEATKPHFASQLVSAIVEANLMVPSISDDMIKSIIRDMAKIADITIIYRDNLLANCIMFIYNGDKKELRVRSFGETYSFISDVEFVSLDSVWDKDELMSSHMYDNETNIEIYLNNHPERIHTNVTKFLIASKSIQDITRAEQLGEAKANLNLLFYPPVGKNYLFRKWGILRKDGYELKNDLSIVSYISDSLK